MEENSAAIYKQAIIDRMKHIMEILELEVDGFAEFTQISKSHIYALLNTKRGLTIQTAEKIASRINLTGSQLLKLDYPIPLSIRKIAEVKKFHDTYKYNPEYFTRTKEETSISYFFENTLMRTDLFDNPVNVRQIREACTALGKNYSSKKVSHTVDYLSAKKKLYKENKLLLKKNGETGTKQFPFYSIEKLDDDNNA